MKIKWILCFILFVFFVSVCFYSYGWAIFSLDIDLIPSGKPLGDQDESLSSVLDRKSIYLDIANDVMKDSSVDFLIDVLGPAINSLNEMTEPTTGLPYDVVDAFSFEPVQEIVTPMEIAMQSIHVIIQRDLGLIADDIAEAKINTILDSIKDVAQIEGFLYAFVNLPDVGEPTSVEADIFNNGQLVAALMIINQAFNDEEIKQKSQHIIDNMDFNFFYDERRGTLYGDSEKTYRVEQFGTEGLIAQFLGVLLDGVPETVFPPSEKIDIRPVVYETLDGEEIKVLPSFGGQAWTILLPLLFFGTDTDNMPGYRGFLENARRWVQIQSEEVKKQGLDIWGWSPCAAVSEDYEYVGNNGISGLDEFGETGDTKTNPVTPYVSFLSLGALSGYEEALPQIENTIENLRRIKQKNPDAYNQERGFVAAINQDGEIAPFLLALEKGMEVFSAYNAFRRLNGEEGIEKYLWSYLEEKGKSEQARELLNDRGNAIMQAIGEGLPEDELSFTETVTLTSFLWEYSFRFVFASADLQYNWQIKDSSLKIDYPAGAGYDWVGAVLNSPIDAGDSTHLAVRVRGIPEDGSFFPKGQIKIELKDRNGQKIWDGYIEEEITQDWDTYYIPLYKNIGEVAEFAIVFERHPYKPYGFPPSAAGEIYIDSISFVK